MTIETTREAIELAIQKAVKAEEEIQEKLTAILNADYSSAEERSKDYIAVDKSGREQQAGRVTVKASSSGNTVADHIKITFKIDGKRASKKTVEDLFYN